jgi:hypothetical protein
VYYGPEVVVRDRDWGEHDRRGRHDRGRHRGQRRPY